MCQALRRMKNGTRPTARTRQLSSSRTSMVGHMSDLSHIEPRDSLTPERLAHEAGTTPEYIARLVGAGAIGADAHGRVATEDVPRVRLTLALADGGIELDD